jgi:integrase/recombinase XerD
MLQTLPKLGFFDKIPIDRISNKDVTRFNNEYILANRYSVTYKSRIINAVKLFYKRVQEKDLNIEKIDRPRKQHKLPNVLSKG